jgi:hypothetical protein
MKSFNKQEEKKLKDFNDYFESRDLSEKHIILKSLYANLDLRGKILFQRHIENDNRIDRKESIKERGKLATALMESDVFNKSWIEKMGEETKDKYNKIAVGTFFEDVYDKDCIANTKWPIPVNYNGKKIGIMNSDGIVQIENTTEYKNLFKNNTIGISSRTSSVFDETNMCVKPTCINEVAIVNESKHIEFDYEVDEIVALNFDEIGIVVEINRKLDWFPYKVRILKATMNKAGEIIECKNGQLKKCDLRKLL